MAIVVKILEARRTDIVAQAAAVLSPNFFFFANINLHHGCPNRVELPRTAKVVLINARSLSADQLPKWYRNQCLFDSAINFYSAELNAIVDSFEENKCKNIRGK